MGTITITGSGFATLPAQAPASWPAGITWPAGQSPNGTKTYTVSDADWQSLISWVANNTVAVTVPAQAPTATSLLLSWVNIWINGTKTAVQQYQTPGPVIPTQITIS